MQIVVDSLLINYTDSGKGQVVLLLHGWGDRLETFDHLQTALTPSYRVIALDLPGFGQSQAPKEVWNLDNYAQLVHNFLTKLGVTEPLTALIGHSNGGALAIRGLSKGSLRAKRLVLLASSGVRNRAQVRRFSIMVVTKIGKIATFWLPRATRQRLRKKLYGAVGSDMLITPQLIETFKRTVKQDIQADAEKLQLPTLLIYGDDDQATPLDVIARPLHKLIANSRLEVMPGAGHFVHHDSQAAVEKLIQEFLKT